MDSKQALTLIKQEFEKNLKNGLLNLQVKWLIDQAEKVELLEERVGNVMEVLGTILKEVEKHCTPTFAQHIRMISNRAREGSSIDVD